MTRQGSSRFSGRRSAVPDGAGGHRARDHDPADGHGDLPGRHRPRSLQDQRGGLRDGHDPMGSHTESHRSDRIRRNLQRSRTGFWPRPRRDHGASHVDRQCKPNLAVPFLPGEHPRVPARLEFSGGGPERTPSADVCGARTPRDYARRECDRNADPGLDLPKHGKNMITKATQMRESTRGQGSPETPSLMRNSFEPRALRDVFLTVGAWLVAAVGAVPLLSVVYMLIVKGGARLSLVLFTELPPAGFEQGGGIGNAIQGTLVTVAIAAVISIPIAVLAAIYLAEFRPDSRIAALARFLSKVLTGFPSILAGVFVYAAVVMLMGSYSALAGGVALAVLMLPTVTLTAEGAMRMVPQRMKDAAIGMGCTNAEVVWHVTLPTALPSIVTGIILAVARVAGESAPLLFTALFSNYWLRSIREPTASLSILIYNFSSMPFDNQIELAWAASLVLVLIVLTFNILSRFIGRPQV